MWIHHIDQVEEHKSQPASDQQNQFEHDGSHHRALYALHIQAVSKVEVGNKRQASCKALKPSNILNASGLNEVGSGGRCCKSCKLISLT